MNKELDEHIKSLDGKISFVNSEFGVDLGTYGNIIRIAINAIQKETIENLIERVTINRELENGLADAGGYTVGCLGESNPKKELIELLTFLKANLPKQELLLKYLNDVDTKIIAVFDNNDLDFINQHIRNRKVEIMSFSALKKMNGKKKLLFFYSFNGQKDFDYLYSLDSEILLLLYKQEKDLYYNYLNRRKKQVEEEIKSKDRYEICGISYTEIADNIIDISTTISGIVARLDEMSVRTYEGYKNECDLLLNEIEEKLIYRIASDRGILFFESDDTLFTEKGDLIKLYKIKVGDKIRVYPKEELIENLYQVAAETNPEIFGIVEDHSTFWKKMVNELREQLGEDLLYKRLKEKGLKILPTTLATYGKGYRKFPMFNNDLRAILRLYYQDKSDKEIDLVLKPIIKSKSTYKSTMIVLGRGLKQELRLFLKEKKIGEILHKRNFNTSTLKAFVDAFMPIHLIISKELFNESVETLEERTLQQIEL